MTIVGQDHCLLEDASAEDASPLRNISLRVRHTAAQDLSVTIATDDQPNVIIFSGFGHKGVNGPILSTGRTVWHKGTAEYRVTHFEWELDYGWVQAGETVESDVCLTIFDQAKETSLESGEELLCTHEHAYIEYSMASAPGRTCNAIPLGGFAFKPGQRLNVASVSNFYPIVPDNEMAKRIANAPGLVAIRWRVRMQRADTMGVPALTSVRSPRRDRSFTTSLIRQRAPSTPYLNAGHADVHVLALGLFLSSIAPPPRRCALELRILVNDVLHQQVPLPGHEPERTSASSTRLMRFSDAEPLRLRPGDVLRAEVYVFGQEPSVYDAAIFILTDAPIGTLEPGEVQLFPQTLDLNGDGAIDLMDYTSDGSIWAELTKIHCAGCKGVHDTQFEWTAHPLPWSPAQFQHLVELVGGIPGSERAHLRVHDTESGMCLNLFRKLKEPKYDVRYCREATNLPAIGKGDMTAMADFDGDGWPDRLRVSRAQPHGAKTPWTPWISELFLALGSREGLQAPEIFWTASSAADFMYVWPAGDGVGLHVPPGKGRAGSLVLLQQGKQPALTVHSWLPQIWS
jgi:hypothetical protein